MYSDKKICIRKVNDMIHSHTYMNTTHTTSNTDNTHVQTHTHTNCKFVYQPDMKIRIDFGACDLLIRFLHGHNLMETIQPEIHERDSLPYKQHSHTLNNTQPSTLNNTHPSTLNKTHPSTLNNTHPSTLNTAPCHPFCPITHAYKR